jgi:hypothetical protein
MREHLFDRDVRLQLFEIDPAGSHHPASLCRFRRPVFLELSWRRACRCRHIREVRQEHVECGNAVVDRRDLGLRERNVLFQPQQAGFPDHSRIMSVSRHRLASAAADCLAGKGCVALRDSPRETLANLSITGHLRGFLDQPVAEIVQCGEPAL